jgi:hypothetical protein
MGLFGVRYPWRIPAARAAVLIKAHYLKIEDEDTISEALDRGFPHHAWRLWGRKGAVARVAALNPQIRDINRLRPGMVIDIGKYAPRPNTHRRVPASLPQTQPQSAAEAIHPKDISDERYGLLAVSPEFSFSRINSTDKSTGGSASYLSNLNPGLRISWGQHWSNRFQTSLNLRIRSETYQIPPGFTLEKTSRTLADFGLGARWIPLESIPDLAIDSGLDFRQELFARSTSPTSTSLDGVMVPELAAGLRYRVLDLSPFSVTLHAQGLFLFPQSTTSYSIQSGTGSSSGAVVTESLSKNVQMSGDLWYSTRSQNSSIATQNRSDVGLTFGVNFRFDAISKPEKLKRGDLP